MSNPIAIEKARDGKRRAIEKVYEFLTLHEETTTSDGDLAERLRLPKQDLQNLRYDLVEIHSLQVRREPKPGRRSGWQSIWTLTEPLNVSKARLEAKWKKDDQRTAELMHQPNASKASRGKAGEAARALGSATPEHPVVPDVLVASAGPEAARPLAQPLAPARHDESRALVEAARQYHNVNKQLDDKVKELEALGMTVDRAMLAKSIKAPHDHRLLIVSQVLPYIDSLERTVERLSSQNENLREKAARVTDVEQTNARLSDQNRRLVSELQTYRSHSNGAAKPEPAPKGDAPAQPVG